MYIVLFKPSLYSTTNRPLWIVSKTIYHHCILSMTICHHCFLSMTVYHHCILSMAVYHYCILSMTIYHHCVRRWETLCILALFTTTFRQWWHTMYSCSIYHCYSAMMTHYVFLLWLFTATIRQRWHTLYLTTKRLFLLWLFTITELNFVGCSGSIACSLQVPYTYELIIPVVIKAKDWLQWRLTMTNLMSLWLSTVSTASTHGLGRCCSCSGWGRSTTVSLSDSTRQHWTCWRLWSPTWLGGE